MKRWIIRSFFIGFLTLYCGVWEWSYVNGWSVVYQGGSYWWNVYCNQGHIHLAFLDKTVSEPMGWHFRMRNAPEDDRFLLTFAPYRIFLSIPFFIPAAAAGAALWAIWRRTTPKRRGRVFPRGFAEKEAARRCRIFGCAYYIGCAGVLIAAAIVVGACMPRSEDQGVDESADFLALAVYSFISAALLSITMFLLARSRKSGFRRRAELLALGSGAVVGGLFSLVHFCPEYFAIGALGSGGFQWDFRLWIFFATPCIVGLLLIHWSKATDQASKAFPVELARR